MKEGHGGWKLENLYHCRVCANNNNNFYLNTVDCKANVAYGAV